MDDFSSESGGKVVKEKKTRRRLRLSCVECTKRRQKCDRKHPCSLCISRGVAHLCRWESVPVARPAPARPPMSALREASLTTSSDQSEFVADLKNRIATLEQELEKAREQQPLSPYLTLSSGSRTRSTPPSSNATDVSTSSLSPVHDHLSELSHRHSPVEVIPEQSFLSTRGSPELPPLIFPLDDSTYQATSSLAHISLAHHGEYIGRGSLICALHSMTSGKVPRFLYAKSTDSISDYRHSTERFSEISFGGSVEKLILYLPSMTVVDSLTTAFFAHVNWRYAVPEEWFRKAQSQMWMGLQHRQSNGPQINPNWLMLQFAILASAPQSVVNDVKRYSPIRHSDDYFMCAMLARRLVEDEFLNVPSSSVMVSAADGTVLGCLATPILCNYLAERGHVSEAWKLAGQGIRNAEAVGMHRDPDWRLWQMMSEEEKLLRRRAWWELIISDKIYSYVLGRPQILRAEARDVDLPPAHNLDGTRNLTNVGLRIMVNLMGLLGDSIETCFNVEPPDTQSFFQMDRRFEEWEEQLPPEYQLECNPRVLQDLSSSDVRLLALQRYFIHSWRMIGRLKFHLAATTGLGCAPPSPFDVKRSMETCITLSLQIIHFQVSTYMSSLRSSNEIWAHIYPGSCWLFEGCFSLFEASVALITTTARLRAHEKEDEVNSSIDSALFVFDDVARREQGKTRGTALKAIDVLTTIRNQIRLGKGDGSQLRKIKDDPDQELLDLSVLAGMNKAIDNPLALANTFPPHSQFSAPSIPSTTGQSHHPKFPRLVDLIGYGGGRDNGRMADHMDVSHVVGIERSAIRQL